MNRHDKNVSNRLRDYMVPGMRALANAASGAAFAMCVCLLVLGLSEISTGAKSANGAQVVEITVLQGDTLWSIATRVSGGSSDPRDVVDRILRLNGLTSAIIHPGQVLLAPCDL